jgi:hypothetical protein
MSILQKLEIQKRINFIEDLSRSDLDLLAKLFSFPDTTNELSPNDTVFPPGNWLASQTDILSSFPPHLLRPTSFLPKLAMNMPFAAPKAELCSTHKPLNPFLIKRVFMQLSAETGLRVQSLIYAVEREDSENKGKGQKMEDGSDGDSGYKEIDPEVRVWLRRLTRLNSLWMNPASYRTKFHVMPDEKRFERLESGCMACILGFVGGRAEAVLDLKTSMLGRMRTGHESRLWGLVEAWTRHFGQAEWIANESKRIGKLVKKERRRARRRRRRERRERRLAKKNSGSRALNATRTAAFGGRDGANDIDDEPYEIGDVAPTDGQGDREAADRDFEGSIIDFYRDTAGNDEESLHPAFRKSVAYDITTGTFHRRSQQPPPQYPSKSTRPFDHAGAASRATFYTQSAYSQDAGFDSSSRNSSAAPSRNQEPMPPPVPPLPRAIANPFVKASSSLNAKDRHIAEKRAESYRKLVGSPDRNPARKLAPSDEEMCEYMQKLWGPSAEEEDKAEGKDDDEEEARNARVQKALADAYGGDRSKADEEKRMTTWSGVMTKGGAQKWLGL